MTVSNANKPPRKRGGQPGNRNANRTGLYAHVFTRQQLDRLESLSKGEFKDEEDLLHMLIDNIMNATRSHKMSFYDWIVAARAIALTVGRIESLERTRKLIYETVTNFQQAMEELKYIPVEED